MTETAETIVERLPDRIFVEIDEETNEKRWYSTKGMGEEYLRLCAYDKIGEVDDLKATILTLTDQRDALEKEVGELKSAIRPVRALSPECINALARKRQIDEDGEFVGVSHQAVDEVHAALMEARALLGEKP